MGLAVIKSDDDVKALYKRADAALYRSKELGRNQLYTLVDDGENKEEEMPDNSPFASYEEFKASFDE